MRYNLAMIAISIACVCACGNDTEHSSRKAQGVGSLKALSGDWYTIISGDGGIEESVVWVKVNIEIGPGSDIDSAWYFYKPLSGEKLRWHYAQSYRHTMTQLGSRYESGTFGQDDNMRLRYIQNTDRFTVVWGDGLLDGTLLTRDNPIDDMGEYRSWLE